MASEKLVHSLLLKLLELESRFERASGSPEGLTQVLEQLEKIVLCTRCHMAYRSAVGCVQMESLIDRLQERACAAISHLERALGEELVRGTEVSRYLGAVSRATLLEGKRLGLNPAARVLFVGCGALPLSCHVLTSHFGCQVVGLDIDSECIALAQEQARKTVHRPRLSFELGHGGDYPLKGFSHLVVASLVQEKGRVLQNALSNGLPGLRLAVRYGEGLQRLVNYPLPKQDLHFWDELDFSSRESALYQTVFLSRREK